MPKAKIILILTFLFFLLTLTALTISTLLRTPPTNKNWNDEGMLIPGVSIATNSVRVENVRDFSFQNTDKEYITDYYSKTYPLDKVKNVYFKVNPFMGYQFAHTYLTFEFEDGEFLSVSVEARKEKGQVYSPVLGTFGTYNLIYIFADEKDITKLRTVVRDDRLYSFKLKLTIEQKNNLFKEVVTRAKQTEDSPEFYNTVFSSCTTNLVQSLNKVLPDEDKIGFDWRIYVPENSAAVFYNKKLLDIDYQKFSNYAELKESSSVQAVARQNRNLDSKEFAKIIHSQ